MTQSEKQLLANETFDSLDIVSRGVELLFDFIETYIESKEAKENLLFDLQNRPQRIEAKIFSLLDTFYNAKEELQKFE